MEEISPPIFISYARVDVARGREVYQWLTRGGLDCWMDEVYLRVGQNWKQEIDKVIRTCQIFVACLSSKAVDHRGFFQTELRTAYEVWKTVPPQHVFLLPIRLDECEIPMEIRDLHCLDFFAPEGPAKLLRDINYYVNPEAPALLLSQALEHIRMRRLDEAMQILERLQILVDQRNPELRLRIMYDLACVHSLKAENDAPLSPSYISALDAASAWLKQWYEFGLGSAWTRTGRTVENEVYRMGSDADLLCLLAKRPVEVRALLESNASALPDHLPRRSSGGGGCILLMQAVETPDGPVRFEALRPGARITSCLLKNGNTPVETRIRAIHTSREQECVVLNGRWIATPSQPFFDVATRKVRAGLLPIGTRLATLRGGAVVVESLERLRGHFEVGIVTTDHVTHNFVCDGLIYENDSK